jgi:Protein of unknown function DUF262/Protein of unknown function (DUF1524)
MDVTTDRRSVQQCLEQRYALPTYQRDYKWEAKHLRELLEDIQDVFFGEFENNHPRTAVSKYEKYFLGTIITIPAEEGRRAIVDGQQRITTLALMISYFTRFAESHPELEISDLGSLLRKKLFGVSQYNIQFSGARARLFDLLCDPAIQGDDLQDAVDAIVDLDDGGRRMYASFTQIHSYLSDELTSNVVPYFVDYLTQCVNLFEIGVSSEQIGHKVFVTMNDRGLKLSPLDLLKGYLLSSITDDAANATAHLSWKKTLDRLQALGQDEDSSFFKDWLRAQYAESIRSKQKDAPPGDFELAADAYHRWVEGNANKLGLKTSDDYSCLIVEKIPFFEGHYSSCITRESQFEADFECLYFNGSRDLTLQSMVLLSALDSTDSKTVADAKTKMVGHYLDCYVLHRFLNGQDSTYSNLRDPLFELVKKIRRKSVTELQTIFEGLFDAHFPTGVSLATISYGKSDPTSILHILARIGHFLEGELELTNNVGFAQYIQRKKSNSTFDIEHLLPSNPEITKKELGSKYDFKTDEEYTSARNTLGGLILLSRGRNRSLRAKPFGEKRDAYATECIMAQTFCDSFYINNPQVKGHIQRLGLQITALPAVTKATINERQALYDNIAGKIWNKARFAEITTETR